jgi:superfamily I DNA/RNA helicase
MCFLSERLREGCQPHEIGVFVRSDGQLKRARNALKAAGTRCVELSEKVEVEDGSVAISTMHFAKGLEFRSVAVMACDDEVIPLQERIESVACARPSLRNSRHDAIPLRESRGRRRGGPIF